ncbi:MAG TPA: hypothetical protein VFX16_25085 [Pseudonocardiaceae bacterium]|nr:hypothetical protein [Pseudonocardiaceae bacterium]
MTTASTAGVAHITQVSALDTENVVAALDQLVERDILTDPGGRLRFRHPLYRYASDDPESGRAGDAGAARPR